MREKKKRSDYTVKKSGKQGKEGDHNRKRGHIVCLKGLATKKWRKGPYCYLLFFSRQEGGKESILPTTSTSLRLGGEGKNGFEKRNGIL